MKFKNSPLEKVKSNNNKISIVMLLLYCCVFILYCLAPPNADVVPMLLILWACILANQIHMFGWSKRTDRALANCDISMRLMVTAHEYAMSVAEISPPAYLKKSVKIQAKLDQLEAAFNEYFAAKL